MRKSLSLRALTILLALLCGIMLSGCSTVQTIVDTVAGEGTLRPLASVPVVPGEMADTADSTPSDASEEVTATASPGASYAPPASTVPFPEMVYERPDVPEMIDEIEDAAEQLGDDPSREKALTLLGNVQNLYDDFRTAETLAMIHNSIDYSDTYWQEEYGYCSQNEAAIQEAMTTFNRALSASSAGKEAGLEPPEDLVDAQTLLPLLNAETELTNRYNSMLAMATVNYDGGTYTYAECSTYEMTTAWTQQNGPALGDIYLQLVNVRNEIAAVSGFNNYIEYCLHVNEKDYTSEMVSNMLEIIAQHMGPIFADVSAKGLYAVDMRLSVDKVFDNMATIFSHLNPELNSALEFMKSYQLYDFSDGPNKETSDYTTYIVNYAAPFILVSFDGSWEQAGTIINEFGHFFNYTQDPDASYHTLDTLEIFSEALELIATNFYTECYSEEDAYMMTYDTLANTYSTFPYQAYLTAFEYEVYALPEAELNYENLCAVSQRQWERFGFDASDPMSALDWTTTPHLFDSPFYTFSYILAGDVAMQLWETSLVDPQNAMNIYMQLMNGAKNDLDFLENIEAAGLVSPFASGEIETLAGYFRSYLIYETGIYGGDIAPAVISATPVPSATPTPVPEAEGGFPISEPSGRYGTYHGFSDGGTSVETYGSPIDPNATPQPTPTPRSSRSHFNSMNHGWGDGSRHF